MIEADTRFMVGRIICELGMSLREARETIGVATLTAIVTELCQIMPSALMFNMTSGTSQLMACQMLRGKGGSQRR